MKLSVT